MAECFWILITPPKHRFLEVLASVSESFLAAGWRLEGLDFYDETKDPAPIQSPTVKDLLRFKRGNVSLEKGNRGIDLDFDFQFPGDVAVGGDESFFYQGEPLNE